MGLASCAVLTCAATPSGSSWPAQNWVKKLASMQDIIDAWMLAQQKWMFLGPVYGSEEIAKQMPKVRAGY